MNHIGRIELPSKINPDARYVPGASAARSPQPQFFAPIQPSTNDQEPKKFPLPTSIVNSIATGEQDNHQVSTRPPGDCVRTKYDINSFPFGYLKLRKAKTRPHYMPTLVLSLPFHHQISNGDSQLKVACSLWPLWLAAHFSQASFYHYITSTRVKFANVFVF